MKTLGLIGGMGWISSAEYYRIINEEIQKRRGGLQFAKCVLYSCNYGEIHDLNTRNDSEGVFALIRKAADSLILAGAEGIVLCANTSHMFADRLAGVIPVPLIHIASATAREIKSQRMSTVGLMGTRYTMEQDFYTAKLNQEGITVIVPEAEDREFIHGMIMDELLKGDFREESKERCRRIIETLHARGAQGIVLGCTELPLILKPEDTAVPLFNTLHIHSLAAVDFALNEKG